MEASQRTLHRLVSALEITRNIDTGRVAGMHKFKLEKNSEREGSKIKTCLKMLQNPVDCQQNKAKNDHDFQKLPFI